MSADAPKGGLRKNAELFSAETSIYHEIELATGPVIKRRVLCGEANADLIVIPRAEFDYLIAADQFKASEVAVIGLVTVGVTIRNGAREPDLRTVSGVHRFGAAADRIIYNTASSGQYVAKMLERLGLVEKIKHKSSILPTGKAVMEALAADTSGNAIGFGHVTEIRAARFPSAPISWVHCREKLAGRPPTRREFGPKAVHPDAARRLAEFLVSTRGKDVFRETGVL